MRGHRVIAALSPEDFAALDKRADQNCRMIEQEAASILKQALNAPTIPEVPATQNPQLVALFVALKHYDTDLHRAQDEAKGPKRREILDEGRYKLLTAERRGVHRALAIIRALLGLSEVKEWE